MSRPAAVLRLANMRKLNATKLAIPKATDMIRQEAVSKSAEAPTAAHDPKPAEESVAQISKTQVFKSKEQPMAAQAPISEEHPTAVHILKPEEQPKAAEASTYVIVYRS